jgi:hypothetical protein
MSQPEVNVRIHGVGMLRGLKKRAERAAAPLAE